MSQKVEGHRVELGPTVRPWDRGKSEQLSDVDAVSQFYCSNSSSIVLDVRLYTLFRWSTSWELQFSALSQIGISAASPWTFSSTDAAFQIWYSGCCGILRPGLSYVDRRCRSGTTDHIEGEESPMIHVQLKYLATASAFASTSALDVRGTVMHFRWAEWQTLEAYSST